MFSHILDKISFWSLLLTVSLLPVFFLPFTNVLVENGKSFLIVVGLVVSMVAWAAARFSDGKIVLPKSKLLLAAGLVPLVTLISALFTGNKAVSFFGVMLDVGTFWFMLALFLVMLFSSVVFRDEDKVKKMVKVLIASTLALFVFQIFRLMSPSFFSLGILGNARTGNLLGTWNSFALFAGFANLFALYMLELKELSKKHKIMSWVLLGLSTFFILAANSVLTWKLLGVFALLVFVYKIAVSPKNEDNKKVFPAISFSVVILCLLFFMSGKFIGGILPNALGTGHIEVTPSIRSTVDVAKGVFSQNAFLGTGPNRFSEAWAMHKPLDINQSQFWDTSFSNGAGLIPTFAITNGILGVLAWLVFLLGVLYVGGKSLLKNIKETKNTKETIFLLSSLYLFSVIFFYSAGAVISVLAFATLGVFVGLRSREEGRSMEFEFLNDPRKSFFSILVLVVLIIINLAVSFKFIEKFASVSYFGAAVNASSVENAELSMGRALLLHRNDLYYRTYAEVHVIKLNQLAEKDEALTEAEATDMKFSFDEAVNGANRAIAYNDQNYLNYQLLAGIYSSVARLGVEGGYEKALEFYQKASELNPINPGIQLSIANIHYTLGELDKAREVLESTIQVAPGFLDAFITLSQVENQSGNKQKAIEYAQAASNLAPTNEALRNYVRALAGESINTSAPVEEVSVDSEEESTQESEESSAEDNDN